MNKRIAGAIIRVSTARQLEGTSPDKQFEAIQALALSHNYLLHEANIWNLAESGAARTREGFYSALDAAETGTISRMYVYNVDRLGRDLLEMLLFLRELEEHGVECWEAEGNRMLVGDDFQLQIEGAVAARERREIRRRTQDGLRRAIEAGKYSGGIIAYGYQLNPENKRLEIAEDEAAVVRMLFDWCSEERLSCVKIAERLNSLGIPTRYAKDGRKILVKGKKRATAGIWRAGRIRHMIRNPAYKGEWHWGKRSKNRKREDWIEGYCPGIVLEETFRRAGRVLDSLRIYEPANKKRNYLLHGFIKCSHCGSAYTGAAYSSGKKTGKYRRYYRCNRAASWKKLGQKKCHAKGIRSRTIEEVVWEDITSYVRDPQVAIKHLKQQMSPADPSLPERLEEVEDQIGELERQKRNAIRIETQSSKVDINALDDIIEEIQASLSSLRAYKSDLRARMDAGEHLEVELFSVAERLSKLRHAIENASYSEKRLAVTELLKGIEVETVQNDNKKVAVITITYRFNDPDPNNSVEVPLSIAADHTSAPAGILEIR